MIANLRQQASTAITVASVAAEVTIEVTRQAYDSAMEQINNLQAGRKYLEDGGAPVEQRLLAKQASINAVELDKSLVAGAMAVIGTYTGVSQKFIASAPVANQEADELLELSGTYERRAGVVQGAFAKLRPAPEAVDFTQVEKDALAILTLKARAVALKAVLSDTAASVGSSGRACASSATRFHVPSVPDFHSGLQNVRGGVQSARACASGVGDATERVRAAKAGKRRADASSDEDKVLLLTKKASADVTALDKAIPTQLLAAAEAYTDAADKMRAAHGIGEGESMEFIQLSADYAARAQMLKFFAGDLPPGPEAASITPEESDAIAILVAKLGARHVVNAIPEVGHSFVKHTSGFIAAQVEAERLRGCETEEVEKKGEDKEEFAVIAAPAA